MDKKNPIFKLVIFSFGLIILLITLGYFLFRPWDDTWASLLISISAILVYLVLFVPILVLEPQTAKIGNIAIGGMFYYRGFVPYALASVVISVALRAGKIKIVPALILYCLALMFFIVYVFIACAATEHIENVETQEQINLSGVQALRQKVGMLVAMNSQIGIEHDDVRKKIQQISENMRYLSPSNDSHAIQLEDQMISLLDDINNDPFFRNSANVSKNGILEKMDRLELLYRQRKAIY